MIRLDAEHSVRALLRLRCIRPWRHSGRWGWALCLDDEPTEWFRTLSDALQSLRILQEWT